MPMQAKQCIAVVVKSSFEVSADIDVFHGQTAGTRVKLAKCFEP